PDELHGLDDLISERPAGEAEIVPPDPAHPHRALDALDVDGAVAAHDVAVRGDPQAVPDLDLALQVIGLEIIAVVPGMVRRRDIAHGIGRRVDGKLVPRRQRHAFEVFLGHEPGSLLKSSRTPWAL